MCRNTGERSHRTTEGWICSLAFTFVQQCKAPGGRGKFKAAVLFSELTVLSFGATLSLA